MRPTRMRCSSTTASATAPGSCSTGSCSEPSSSCVAAILAIEVELLLHRAIGEAEQHRFLTGRMRDPGPAGCHEDVLRAPFEHLLADLALPRALDRHEHGGVGRAIAMRGEAAGQELDEGADARHGIAAAGRVGV